MSDFSEINGNEIMKNMLYNERNAERLQQIPSKLYIKFAQKIEGLKLI